MASMQIRPLEWQLASEENNSGFVCPLGMGGLFGSSLDDLRILKILLLLGTLAKGLPDFAGLGCVRAADPLQQKQTHSLLRHVTADYVMPSSLTHLPHY